MRFTAFIFVLCMILVCSCTTKYERSPIQTQQKFVVALEKNKTGLNYGHPYEIRIETFKKIMASLKYDHKEGVFNWAKKGDVFQKKEIERLAGPVVEALSKSDHSSYARFVSLSRKKSLMLFTTFQQTEGIVFRDEAGKLNFAFSQINKKIDTEEGGVDETTLKAEFSGKDPVMVEKSNTTLVQMPPEVKRHVSENGRAFPMWVAIDLGKTSFQNTAPAIAKEPENKFVQTKEVKETVPQHADKKEEVREKLRYLKTLLDEGLISETDYDTRKNVLLDQLK